MSVSGDALPVVSVCIANYNGAAVIVDCIESVLRQRCSAPVEIIVHDDASTDASAQLVAERYPSVRLLTSAQNVGFCISNNRMAAVACGRYLLLLNNDATLRDGALQGMVDAATAGFDGILSVPQFDARSGRLLDRGCRMDLVLMPVPITTVGARNVASVMGACLWLPSELWQRIGGFPDWLGSIGEDLFLCLAAWNAGPGVRVLESSGYDHLVGHSFGGGKATDGRLQTTLRRRFLSERNRLCVLLVFCPGLLLLPTLLLYVATMLLEGLLLTLLRGNARVLREVYVAALRSAWQLRPQVRHERRRLQHSFGRFALRSWLRLLALVPQKLRAVWRHGVPDVR